MIALEEIQRIEALAENKRDSVKLANFYKMYAFELRDELIALRQQLAERDAVIAKKDDALRELLNYIDVNAPNSPFLVVAIDALALTQSSSVLDEYVMSRLEKVDGCFLNKDGRATLAPKSECDKNPPLYRLKDK